MKFNYYENILFLIRVEVDCRGIFKPGQLGVAMSRARDCAGLRITHFTTRACMPHPSIVKDFIDHPSQTIPEGLNCCKIEIRYENTHLSI